MDVETIKQTIRFDDAMDFIHQYYPDYILSLFDSSSRKQPPVNAGIIPFVGALPGFARNSPAFIYENYKKYGDVFTLKMFGRRLTFFIGVDASKQFFLVPESTASPQPAYRWTVPVFGPGVVYDCPPPKMLQQLRFIKNLFTTSEFKRYIPIFEREIRQYFDTKWGNEGEVDILEVMSEITILTATAALLGKEIRASLKSKETAQMYSDLDKGFTPLGFFFPNLPIKAFRERDHARKAMGDFYNKVINQRRKEPHTTAEDVLDHFLQCKYKNGESLPDHEISGLMIALLLAGQHTSSATTSWMSLLFSDSKNSATRTKALQEQETLFRSAGAGDKWSKYPLSYDLLKKMNYLDSCMKETLRLYPPIVIMMRQTYKQTKYKGFEIPAGDLICVSPLVTHHIPEYFPDHDTFRPSRFMGDTPEDSIPLRHIPFGAGRHGCIGEAYAYLQVKAVMSILLRDFEVTLVGNEMSKPDYNSMIVIPNDGPGRRIKYRRRVPLKTQN